MRRASCALVIVAGLVILPSCWVFEDARPLPFQPTCDGDAETRRIEEAVRARVLAPASARPVAEACAPRDERIGAAHGTRLYDECNSDADCASGEACKCGDRVFGTNDAALVSHCVKAECHVDADCGSLGPCSYTPPVDTECRGPSSPEGFYCHTTVDTCHVDGDCPLRSADDGRRRPCQRSASGTWKCEEELLRVCCEP